MAEYKVILQDDTEKKLKNILNIGTVDEEYVIEDNGVIDVDTFIDHTKINVNVGNVNVHLDEEPQLLTTQGEQTIISEEQEGDVTTYSGPRKVKVQVGLEQVTDATQVNAIVDKGVIGSNNAKIVASVKSNVDSSVINKAIDFTIFEEDHKPSVPALDLKRAECIAYYNIDEVSNYTGYEDIQLDDIEDSGDDTFMFHIQGKIGTDEERTYPYDSTKLGGYIAISKAKLAELGYELKKLDSNEEE